MRACPVNGADGPGPAARRDVDVRRVLAATLVTFQNFDTPSRRTVDRTAAQDSARTSADRIVRDLRNLASPTIAQPQAVDKASDYDFVFQTVDSVGPNTGANAANIKRVRWCLDQSTPEREALHAGSEVGRRSRPPRPRRRGRARARAGRAQPSSHRTSRTPTGARAGRCSVRLVHADRDPRDPCRPVLRPGSHQDAQRDAHHVGRVPAQPERGARRIVHLRAQRVLGDRPQRLAVLRPRGRRAAVQLAGRRRQEGDGRDVLLSGHRQQRPLDAAAGLRSGRPARQSPRP